jgi:hypothetical protein
MAAPDQQDIRNRFMALERQRESYSSEYRYIEENGVENCFRASIGYHVSLAQGLQLREADRLKEVLSVCLHGCPDCLILGNKCNEGGFLEKYHVSKVITDEYFRHITEDITVEYSSKDAVIEALLSERGVTILSAVVSKGSEARNAEKLEDRISELRGKRIAEKFVKFAGFWVDCPIGAHQIRYCAMVVLR